MERMSKYLLLFLTLLPFLIACNEGPAIDAVAGTVSALESVSQALATTIASHSIALRQQAEIISYLATRGPFVATPFPPGAEPTPYRPVAGSVLIEDGRCCAGGRAGS